MLLKMLYSLAIKEKKYLGIDIGSSSIKAIVLSKSSGEIKLDSLIVVELPKDTLKNKEICKFELFENALKLLRSNIPRTIKNSAIALSGSQVITKIIQVDGTLSDTEIEYYLYGNLKLLTSKVVGEVNIDFVVIGENKTDENLKDVFVVMAKQSLINARILALKKSGFHCSVVDLESHALMRSLQLQFTLAKQQGLTGVLANLHLGAMTTLLIVISDGVLVFSRELNIGVVQLTIKDSEILDHAMAQKLSAQLSHCLQNYSSIFGGNVIDTWFSSGGGSHFSELILFIANALEVNISICQPLNELHCFDKKTSLAKQESISMQGCFQVALGLAARGLK